MSLSMLEKILTDRPKIHSGETETNHAISEGETIYSGSTLDRLNGNEASCCGIARDVARFIYDSVSENSATLETGAGLSTLIFALRGCKHVAVTPNSDEAVHIKEYASVNGISMEHVEFVTRSSDEYLPKSEHTDLDFVFIDGKHAFPWPIIDWFYLADKLKNKGILVLDDLELVPVAILADFLSEDRRWASLISFRGHTKAFRKIASSVHDVAWHMQPYVARRYVPESRVFNLVKRVAKKAGIPRYVRRFRNRSL